MKTIRINKINKIGNRIEFEYEQNGLDEYIDISIKPYYEYQQNIESVPDSIAVIPFLSNLLPMCFVLDVEVYVKSLDQTFYNAISDYRKGYQEMIPMIHFAGRVIVDELVENSYKVDKNCLLFSGGIDATNSLSVNDDIISDCITIWGSDIRSDNIEGWKVVSRSIEDTVKKFNKNWLIIRSNFRDYIQEGNLGACIKATQDNWWHAMQHGVALLGQVAPLAYLNRYNYIFIASSYTKDFRLICASDPLTDTCFKVGYTSTIHDGFEFDRCQKVKNIFNKIDEMNVSLNLHVCWESSSGTNCGHCEKCIRSYLNCRAVGKDCEKIGLKPTLSSEEIKKFYLHRLKYNDNIINQLSCIINSLKATFGKEVPQDLKWLAKLNPEKVNKSIYWTLKKIYHKIKGIMKSEK